MPHHLHGAQRHAEVQRAIQQQRHAHQHHQHLSPLGGPQHQQQSDDACEHCQHQYQPPLGNTESPGVHGDLDLEQAVRQHGDAEYHAQKAHGFSGVAQGDDAHSDEQYPEGQVVLKRQPEQVLGEVPAQLDGAAHHHADAQRPADPRHAPLRHHQQHHAQHAEQHRHHDISGFHGPQRARCSHIPHNLHLPSRVLPRLPLCHVS